MKIEKCVEAVKVKVKEKATWIKENPKEAAKSAAKGLVILGPSALACWLGIRNSEKNQIIIEQQQEISELSDENELYVESIGILQEEVLELREQVSEDKGIIKKLASELLRRCSSLGGKTMNSLKRSDSDFDDPQ